jgi:hypothetical protein
MATIVNNTPTPTDNSGGNGFLGGVILLIVFVILLIYFGIPFIRNMGPIQVNTPAPQINLPGKIDVNINQQKK